jgi:hypothetical protein
MVSPVPYGHDHGTSCITLDADGPVAARREQLSRLVRPA